MQNNRNYTIKIIGIISAIAVGISVLFPFLKMTVLGTTMGISLSDGNAWIEVAIIAILGLVFSCLENYYVTIASGIAGIAYTIYKLSQASKIMSNAKTSEFASNFVEQIIERGAGFYLLLLGSIGLLIVGILGPKRNRSVDPEIDVYWIDEGIYYHSDIDCKSLDGVESVTHSTALEAESEGKKPCPICVLHK